MQSASHPGIGQRSPGFLWITGALFAAVLPRLSRGCFGGGLLGQFAAPATGGGQDGDGERQSQEQSRLGEAQGTADPRGATPG